MDARKTDWGKAVIVQLRRALAAVAVALATTGADSAAQTTHAELVDFYDAWRAFEMPAFEGGVPDYTQRAMDRQHAELEDWMDRLYAMNVDGWPIAQQIDWHLIRAEMNGLDFDHRVRRPWARDPAFYATVFMAESDVPAHEGMSVHGFVDTWKYDYPLSAADAAEITEKIGAIPGLLEQARGNLDDSNARDLWLAGDRSFGGQARDLEAYGRQVAGTSRELDASISAAADASESFRTWLEAEAPSKTGPSGVGEENYTWYMQNVHLVPYTWSDQVMIMRRELARSHSSMRLEENRNRHLPPKKIRLRKRRIPPAMSKRGPRLDVDNGHSKRNVALLANCVSRKIWFVVCTQNLCGTRAWIPMVAPFGAITCTQGGAPIMTTISIAG